MNLQFALVTCGSDTGCQVTLLDNNTSVGALYAEPMLEHQIFANPGDLVAVDQTKSPTIVFRWPITTVKRVENDQIFVTHPCAQGQPLTSVEGLSTQIKQGDQVFIAFGKVYDVAEDGRPVEPERLSHDFFPEIANMYQAIEAQKELDPKQVVAEGYDRIAERYLELDETGISQARNHYTNWLLRELSPGSTVLDLGCGAGVPVAISLAKRFDVTGVDISARQVELARANVPNARFIQADVTQHEFPLQSFGAVIAFYSLIHIPRDQHPALLRKIATWLRPAGIFVATMGARSIKADFDEYLGTQMYWSHFDSDTNKRLIKEVGLDIVSAEEITHIEFGSPVTFLWVIAKTPQSG